LKLTAKRNSAHLPGGGAKPIAPGAGSKPSGNSRPVGLHVVATPIGNLRDITLRAIDTLSQVDIIACEDTRVTSRLLNAHNIRTPMTAYHEHNAKRVLPRLIERLQSGQTMALVSDAGTPLISDPGYRLVRAAQDAGIPVTTEPGPSAPLAALVLSGLPSDRFLFAGFLPVKSAARKRALGDIAGIAATLVFFESPRRLAGALADMAEMLGPREAAVARELTKLHEELRRGVLAELAAHYRDAGPPKGEAVVVVGPPAPDAASAGADEIDALLVQAMELMSVRDAASTVAAASGLARRGIYARALEIAAGSPNRDPAERDE
jgi:16S rRNA (cytidine1402-2'-O)-methyltransferase